MTDHPKPKPCPFCGAKPTVVDDAAVIRALRSYWPDIDDELMLDSNGDIEDMRKAILAALNGDQT